MYLEWNEIYSKCFKMLGILLEYWIKNIIGIFVIGSIVFDVKCYVGISKFKNIRDRVNNEWGWKDI